MGNGYFETAFFIRDRDDTFQLRGARFIKADFIPAFGRTFYIDFHWKATVMKFLHQVWAGRQIILFGSDDEYRHGREKSLVTI